MTLSYRNNSHRTQGLVQASQPQTAGVQQVKGTIHSDKSDRRTYGYSIQGNNPFNWTFK